MAGSLSLPTGLQTPSDNAAALCLEIVGGPYAGRQVILTASRCTLGSGPQCTFRLRARGIAAVHCVIDRSGPESIVYGVDGQTLLDGLPLSRAALRLGSHLQVGPLEFRVLRDGRRPESPVEPAVIPAPPAACEGNPVADEASAVAWESRLEELQSHIDQLDRNLLEHAARTADRTDALAEQLQSGLTRSGDDWVQRVVPQAVECVRGDVMAWLHSELSTAQDRLSAEIGSRVTAQITADVTRHVSAELGETLRSNVSQQLSDEQDALRTDLVRQANVEASRAAEESTRRIKGELEEHLSDQVHRLTDERVQRAVSELGQEVSRQVAAAVPTGISEELDRCLPVWQEKIAVSLSATIPPAVAAEVTPQITQTVAEKVSQQVTETAIAELTRYLDAQLTTVVGPDVARQAAEIAGQQTSQRIDELLAARLPEEVSKLSAELNDRLSVQISDKLQERLPSEVMQQVAEHLETVLPTLRSALGESLAIEIFQRVSDELLPQLTEQLGRLTSAQADAELPPELYEYLRNAVAEQAEGLSDQLAREVTDRVRNQLIDQIANQVTRQVAAEQAAFEAQRTAWEQQQLKSQGEINTHAQHLEQRLEALMRFQRGLDEQHQQWQHDLHALRPEFLARAEQLEAQIARLGQPNEGSQEGTLEGLQRQQELVSEQTRQLADRLDELTQRWDALETRQQARGAQCDSPRSDPMDHRLAEIRAEREAFEHDRHPLAEDASHPGEHPRAMEDRLAELNASRQFMQRQRQHVWATDASDSPQPHAQPADSREPPLADEDLPAENETSAQPQESSAAPVEPSRLFAHLLRDDDETQPAAEEDDRPLAAAKANPTVSESSPEEDDSIENYMARLMDRVRDMQGSTPATPAAQVAAATTHSRKEPAPTVPEMDNESETKIKCLSEIAPRATPAELTSNLSAMRDLANTSARSAIDAHSKRRMRSMVWGKLIVAFVALASAVALAWMSSNTGQLAYSAALVSTIVAVIWGVEYLLISGYGLWFKSKPAQLPPPEPDESPSQSE